ncbi:MAG: ECF-type sigma factor [Verrucomicrobiales bacterium]
MPGRDQETHYVTRLLGEIAEGKDSARDDLISAVYDQLRKIAQVRMNAERPGHTLQATALVNEACLRLLPGLAERNVRDRYDFYGAAAEAMRRVLIDHARGRMREKRGGGEWERVPLNTVADLADAHDPMTIIALNDAFEHLAQAHPDRAEVVRLRFFAGLSVEETAATLGVSEPTVKRRWRTARALLFQALNRQVDESRDP